MSEGIRPEQSRQLLAAIVDSSDDAIVGKDLNGIITNWNEGARRIFGYDESEIIGKSILTLIPPELRAEESVIIGRIRQGERVEHFETRRVRKDGSHVELSLTVSPIRDAEGRVIGASKIARDITDRKRIERDLAVAQAQLQSHATELEKRVHDRTRALQKTIAELEAFSYSLTHDLRAPLRAIESYLEIFVEDFGGKVGAEGVASLQKAIAASRRMDRMVLDLLAFTRLSHEEVPVDVIDIEKVVGLIVHDRPEFHFIRADIRIESPLLPVVGNLPSLVQCLTNLLDNAVKFVAPGVKSKIRIYTESRDGMVRLWVEDNGIGISAEDQAQIFRMFHRGGSGDYPGTGIGLAIVRKAVERMGGSAGIESQPGRGSRFWVQLPRAAS
jgi:PAS domain S-box-containing protein